MARAPAIGIDLGSWSSSVAVFQNGKVEVLANEQGNRSTPTVVAFTDNGRLVGDDAKRQLTMNPANTIYGAQRLIGRKFEDSSVQGDMKHWPFEVINDGGKPKVSADYKGERKTFYPEEISAMVLAKMKETAEKHLGKRVTDAVVTVPAYFNYLQRQATRDAATIAGLNVLRMVSGSTAAAIANYGVDRNPGGIGASSEERTVLVFDLGGGTTSVSILTIEDGLFQVKSTAGDTHLGGEDFDSRMVNHFVLEFKTRFGGDITTSKLALARLRTACEAAKRALSSTAAEAPIEIDSLFDGIDFGTSITRAHFQELNADLFEKTVKVVEQVLRDAKIDKSQIDDIILVGGSSRIPRIQQLLQDFFNGKELVKCANPDEAAATGAAVLAATLNGDTSETLEDFLLLDIFPFYLGVETFGGVMSTIVIRYDTIPTKQTRRFNYFDERLRERVLLSNPTIKVYEGNRVMTRDNLFLGELDIRDLVITPPGLPEIEITFDMDTNDILKVTAVEMVTGTRKFVKTTITNERNRLLRNEEIERIIRETQSEQMEDEMREEEERLSAKKGLEQTCGLMKSVLEELVEEDGKTALESCNEVLRWLDDDNQQELAGKEEFEDKERGLELIRKSLIRKLQVGGGGGGAGFSGAKRSRTT